MSLQFPFRIAIVLAGSLITGAVPAAEETATPAEPPAVAEATAQVVLRANTLIPLRLLDTVDSATSQGGAKFSLMVTDDIFVDDTLVIPARSVAEGEVIHAAKAGVFGKAGELSITSRFVTVGERRIRLRSLLASAGQNKADLAAGVGLFVPFAPFFIRGKDLLVPAGTELIARVAADETFAATAPAPP